MSCASALECAMSTVSRLYTETWFQEDYTDQLSQVQGFQMVHQDRNTDSGKSKGRGMCVFINPGAPIIQRRLVFARQTWSSFG